ncbi:MAG TPA: histidinol dehydrogenase [Acidobacteria bacterium]|nr:histidinol dehydrogenase [Acidobacteriota bacterium]
MSARGDLFVHARTPEGRQAVERLLGRGAQILDPQTLGRAGEILDGVRREGDAALVRYARELDGAVAATAAELALAPGGGRDEVPPAFVAAMEEAIRAVERFHAPQVRSGYVLEKDGVWLEERIEPLRRVGVYVPGGRAAYPSTVVMTVVPARVAGVAEIAVATPPGSYRANAALRWTLERLGVREIWGMGGAHAVAAFAYGTGTIRRVDKIVGPGNAWVTAAKKLVVGDVAIDGIAGPSEVVILADGSALPIADRLAADLLAQAEHDPQAAAVLITPDPRLAYLVGAQVELQLTDLATAETARASWERFGAILVVESLDEAVELVNRIAPEHLQLVGPSVERLADRIHAAGAVFLGPDTPEVFGDYIAGPSHVLPTCGSARFTSALGVEDFLRRSHRIRFTPAAAARRAEAAAVLADAEGLPAHAASARRRLR